MDLFRIWEGMRDEKNAICSNDQIFHADGVFIQSRFCG